jgi:PPK2 family polyphosphate:nucleotide phosphotransferase
MAYAWKFDAGKPVDLSALDPRHDAGLDKDDSEPLLERRREELAALQETCFAAGRHAVLIVLQGMDTSGKGGTIERVMGAVNPQGCRVTAFKAPTELELSRDFLWRVHAAVPGRGAFGIFDRSHYEDVLAVRVRRLAPEAVWRARYDRINHFERLLADEGTIILKFLLHISKQEQAERLQAREAEPDKRWKISVGDYEQRLYWDDYRAAFEEALQRCGTPYAPWYVVPADRKWFRDLAVADTLVAALRPYGEEWQRAMLERGQRNYDQLLAARRAGRASL